MYGPHRLLVLFSQVKAFASVPRGRDLRSPVVQATAGAVMVGVVAQLSLAVSGVLSARLLGPTDRGYLAIVILVPSIISQAGSLGISLALTYFIARRPR